MFATRRTDAEREWPYDRNSLSANSTRPSTPAQVKGWTVVDMKTDWNKVFPPEK